MLLGGQLLVAGGQLLAVVVAMARSDRRGHRVRHGWRSISGSKKCAQDADVRCLGTAMRGGALFVDRARLRLGHPEEFIVEFDGQHGDAQVADAF